MKNICIFYRPDNPLAERWASKISKWLENRNLAAQAFSKNAHTVIVLGGDGTILEAARKYPDATILGLNLGHVGFLAAVRNPKNFLPALDKFFKGKYWIIKRMMLEAAVIRKGKRVLTAAALNDIAIQNPLGLVELGVEIENHPIQYIQGTGALISTATGSTAYNLSAHGPIIMPNIECMVLTELLDHNIPTPSMVINKDEEISIKIINFRRRELLSIAKTKEPFDVLLAADGEKIFPLENKDIVVVRRSKKLIKFAEMEKNYFFKSLQEKFAFK